MAVWLGVHVACGWAVHDVLDGARHVLHLLQQPRRRVRAAIVFIIRVRSRESVYVRCAAWRVIMRVLTSAPHGRSFLSSGSTFRMRLNRSYRAGSE